MIEVRAIGPSLNRNLFLRPRKESSFVHLNGTLLSIPNALRLAYKFNRKGLLYQNLALARRRDIDLIVWLNRYHIITSLPTTSCRDTVPSIIHGGFARGNINRYYIAHGADRYSLLALYHFRFSNHLSVQPESHLTAPPSLRFPLPSSSTLSHPRQAH